VRELGCSNQKKIPPSQRTFMRSIKKYPIKQNWSVNAYT
jgi:hypothetical protein